MEGELAADEVKLDVPVRVEVLYPLLGAVGGVELPREQPVIVKLGVQTMSRSTPEDQKVSRYSESFSGLRSGPGD